MDELILKIDSLNNDMEKYTIDIKCNIKEKNNEIECKQKIFIFGPKKNLELLDADKTTEVFMDSTFKVIPKK